MKQIAFKTRCYPNNKQESWLKKHIGYQRLAYNYAVSFFESAQNWFPSVYEIQKCWDREKYDIFPWLRIDKSIYLSSGQLAINTNFKNALRKWKEHGYSPKKGKPKYKSKAKSNSVILNYMGCSVIDDKRVKLPKKMGTIRLAEKIPYDGKPMQFTFTNVAGKWYVSILVRLTEEISLKKEPRKHEAVGVDFGVANYAVLSDGTFVDEHKNLFEAQVKLKKLQRELSRKKKFSKNFYKTKRKIGRLSHRIANMRKWQAENFSKKVAERYEYVCLEDLSVSSMTKSAKGTIDKPGKNVKVKASLNREILNKAWYNTKMLIERKAYVMRVVDPKYTSQTCRVCGHVDKENRKSQDKFVCSNCGHSEHADLNAAKNIVTLGMM